MASTSLREATLCRLDAFLKEVNRLLGSEFPYDAPRVALERIKEQFMIMRTELSAADATDEHSVRLLCLRCGPPLFLYLKLLGFLLRATNVRNAFEVYGPLARLAERILGGGGSQVPPTLVLSSEWEYSPSVVYRIEYLPGFVLIGLPACETGNPLLMPLAGHEIGHAWWWATHMPPPELTQAMDDAIGEAVLTRWDRLKAELGGSFNAQRPSDPIGVPAEVAVVSKWVDRQAQETFCDLLGVRLFGRAFLKAFAYLLAPGTGFQRSERYPPLKARARYIAEAARHFAGEDTTLSPDPDYESLFDAEHPPDGWSGADKLKLEIADTALDTIVDRLRLMVGELFNKSGIGGIRSGEVERILDRFRLGVPCEDVTNLAEILDAAWLAFETADLWQGTKLTEKRGRVDMLYDLVLKNVELYEYEQLRGSSNAT